MYGLQLDELTAEDSETPGALIWVPKKSKLDFDAAQVVVNAAAKELLSPEELKGTVWAEPGEESLLWLPAPLKSELLGSLVEGDGQEFVALLVSQFDLMARFVPVLDKVFRECLRKE